MGSDFALFTGIVIWIGIRSLILLKGKKYRMISIHRELLINLMVVYVILALSLTIFPIDIIWGGTTEKFRPSVNIIPFIEVFRNFFRSPFSLAFRTRILLTHFAGNLLLLMPMGIFVPILWIKARSFKRIVIIGALVSLSIELLQYALAYLGYGRVADIDDLILNILGVMIGYMIFDKILMRFSIISRFIKNEQGLSKWNM